MKMADHFRFRTKDRIARLQYIYILVVESGMPIGYSLGVPVIDAFGRRTCRQARRLSCRTTCIEQGPFMVDTLGVDRGLEDGSGLRGFTKPRLTSRKSAPPLQKRLLARVFYLHGSH